MQKMFFISSIFFTLTTLFLQQITWFFILSGIILFVYILKHRAITHQISFVIIIPGIFILCAYYFYNIKTNIIINSYLFFVLGAIGHIVIDRITTKFKQYVSN